MGKRQHSKLDGCPFCNGNAHVYAIAGRLFAECKQCNVKMPGEMYEGMSSDDDFWEKNWDKTERLIARWNKRR